MTFYLKLPCSNFQFTTTINPGCTQLYPLDCSKLTNVSLVHIQSDGKSDSYHFLWSFIGAPTLMMARTSLNTSLSVDWVEMFETSVNATIRFEPKPYYTFGWGLVKV
jgi:hypothetical protein